MTTRKEILQSNFEASRLDYVGAFIRLWVSFNTWYNDQSTESSELRRVLHTRREKVIANRYWANMENLKNPAYNDNFEHIIDTVVGVSTTPSGTVDSTGFRYRLICNRANIHTRFLALCISDPILKDWCHGITQFNTETRKDALFGQVYIPYKKYMFDHIYKRFDAVQDIPTELETMGIKQYGCTLYHKQKESSLHSDNCNLVSISDIYGSNFLSVRARASKYKSRTAVLKAYPSAGREGKLYRWHESSNLDIMQRELLLLYKLRCSIIHGDRDAKSADVQEIARHAYDALDDLMSPLFS